MAMPKPHLPTAVTVLLVVVVLFFVLHWMSHKR